MAIQNRTTTLPGIWASNAQTTIPTPPVAGVTYRDTTLNSTAIDKAWPFKTIVDSSDFNQHAFLQDTLIKEAEQYGIMRWNNTTTYKEGGFCLGQDGKIYQAKRDNQGKEPTASSDDWGIYPELSPYQLKSNLSQVIDSSTTKYPSNKAVQDFAVKKDLSNVSANIDYVVESWTDGLSFYRKFKSGWLEQGIFSQTIDSAANKPYMFTLIRPFKTAHGYEVHITSFGTDDTTTGPNITLTDRQTTSVTIVNQGYDTGSNHRSFNWYACGQGA